MESPVLYRMAKDTPPFWRQFAKEFFPGIFVALIVVPAFIYFFREEFRAVVMFPERYV